MSTKGQRVVAEMKRHLGSWYLWGGIGPNRFDCSGLGYYSFPKAVGVHIPRSTYGQIDAGKHITLGKHQPGDAILLHRVGGQPQHVIWATGYGTDGAIHAPHTGAKVELCSIKAKVSALGLVGVRRYLPDEPKPKPYDLPHVLKYNMRCPHAKKYRGLKGQTTKGRNGDRITWVTVGIIYRDRIKHKLKGKPRIVDAAYAHKLGWTFKGKA